MTEYSTEQKVAAKQRFDEVRGMYLRLRDKLTPDEIAEWDKKLKDLEKTLEAMGANHV